MQNIQETNCTAQLGTKTSNELSLAKNKVSWQYFFNWVISNNEAYVSNVHLGQQIPCPSLDKPEK